MPTCAEPSCRRWRPSLGGRFATGVRLNSQWYCSPQCVEPTVRAELAVSGESRESAGERPGLRLGAILRHHRVIDQAQLLVALEAQRRSGLRLGAQLQVLGLASPEAVVRALAEQAGMSYLTSVDLSLVRRAPGHLPGPTVRALGLVPFEAEPVRRRLHVLCVAPPPRASFRALTALTDWQAEPYLVDDAVWQRAIDAYPTNADLERRAWSEPTAAHVAARVVRAVAERRPLRVRRAECGGLVWVRLEDDAHAEDLFLRAPKEEPCLVASTPH